jgi:hypothetical protein
MESRQLRTSAAQADSGYYRKSLELDALNVVPADQGLPTDRGKPGNGVAMQRMRGLERAVTPRPWRPQTPLSAGPPVGTPEQAPGLAGGAHT